MGIEDVAIVVVDPFSSGTNLVDEIIRRGALVISVQSSSRLAISWKNGFDEKKYHASIVHENIVTTLEFLNALNVQIRAIFPGSEPGVLLAEELQLHFPDVPSNVPDPTGMRRHKHAMHNQLKQCNLRSIREICTGDVEEALLWIDSNVVFPVIVKPPMSGGSDGLHYCHSVDDVRDAFRQEKQKLNVNGEVNTQLLVQEFLTGEEYVVDAVSHNGEHLVLGIWKYSKLKNAKTRAIVYEYSDFLKPTGSVQQALLIYMTQVFQALGIRNGATHSEVMLDERGPCLVETGARMHGGVGAKGIELATGLAPYTLLTDIALGGTLFQDLYRRSSYVLKSNVLAVDLRNFKYEGRIARSIEDSLSQFSTVSDINALHAGEKLLLTRDMATSPGVFLMSHPDEKVIFSQLDSIRRLEDTTLYETLEMNLINN